MSVFRASLALILFAVLAISPALHATVHHAHPHGHALHHAHNSSGHRDRHHRFYRHHRYYRRHRRPRGQQAIAPERVTQIQQALARVHYYSGADNGEWDSATKAAMQKYQADQGWQTKLVPDARALKKLGLGPDYSNAINAKNSSFAAPPPTSDIPAGQSAAFAEDAGVAQ